MQQKSVPVLISTLFILIEIAEGLFVLQTNGMIASKSGLSHQVCLHIFLRNSPILNAACLHLSVLRFVVLFHNCLAR